MTSINTSNLTIGSGANRALVVQIAWSAAVTSPALKWDNAGTPQSLAAITGATATNTAVAQCWGLVAPTSGAKQLNAAWTTARDIYINGVSWTGVDQTGGATSFPHGTGATGSSATASVTVTSASGNAAMAVFTTAVDGYTAVNNTQTFIDNSATNHAGAGNRAAGAASVTLTGTQFGSATWASAGSDILASSAAAAQVPYQPLYLVAPVLAQ